MMVEQRFRVSAQDATTVTLLPVAGTTGSGLGLASPLTQIVLTMAARDTYVFDIVERQFNIIIERK